MGEALLSGLLRSGDVAPSGVIAAVRRSDRAAGLRDSYGIEVLSAAEAASRAETLVVAVKPQDMAALLGEISGGVTAEKLVISIPWSG
jgi:pyrroline-5-carboxylate reductase